MRRGRAGNVAGTSGVTRATRIPIAAHIRPTTAPAPAGGTVYSHSTDSLWPLPDGAFADL